jgi:isopenicillin N synthase-like dioxygenase
VIRYAPPKTSERLPIVDLRGSLSSKLDERQAVADQIGAAARDTGFFYVSNHGIAPAFVDGVFAAANRFFDQPGEQKALVTKRAGFRGYEGLLVQQLDAASPPDIKESYNVAHDFGAPTPDPVGNLWPELPGFREALDAYYHPMIDLGRHLMRLLALSLGEPESTFDAAFKAPSASLRLLRYPPQPGDAAQNQLGAGAHTDWGAITLLAQDDCGGLEVENARGEWLRAVPVPDTFVVNLGDMIARWTNGLYHSNMHRVMNNVSGRNRHSLVLFFNPEYYTPVSCLPTCLTAAGGQAKYPACTAGEHIAQRYRESRQHAAKN